MISVWTQERIDLLMQMHGDGHPFSVIARELGGGITRCAVAGKALRLGLTAAQAKSRYYGGHVVKVNRVRNEKKKKEKKPVERIIKRDFAIKHKAQEPKSVRPRYVEPPSLGLSILDLTNGACRWPHGEGPYMFCGHQRKEGESYCPFHDQMSRAHGSSA